MNFEMITKGSYPALQVTIDPGDTLVAEAGAMAWMDPAIQMKTSARGGIGAGLKRSLLGGESFFQNEYTTSTPGARIVLVSGQPGDIRSMEMDGQRIFLERGAYLASTPGVTMDSKWQGLKGMLAEGMFALQASGSGTLFWNAYGDVEEVQVAGQYVVDNGYAVAWDASLSYNITRSGRKIRSFLADQLIMNFTGHGRVWVQSRSPFCMSAWVYPFRPQKSRG